MEPANYFQIFNVTFELKHFGEHFLAAKLADKRLAQMVSALADGRSGVCDDVVRRGA